MTKPCVICTVPVHVTSGSALIDACPTPIISMDHSVLTENDAQLTFKAPC